MPSRTASDHSLPTDIETFVRLRPFCSSRCADVDLHRWLCGTYRIPVEDEEGDETPAPARDPDAE